MERKIRSRIPRVSFALSAIILIGLASLRVGAERLHSLIRLDPAVVNFATIAGLMMILSWWAGWSVFYGFRKRWAGALAAIVLLGIPIFFYLVCRPVFDGDLGIARFDGFLFRRAAEGNKEIGNEVDGNLEADLTSTTSGDFPRFLGPQGNGVIADRRLVGNWEENPPRELWRQPVGAGWSGCSAVGQYFVTMEQLGSDECVSCYLLESGKPVWRFRNPQRHEDLSGLGKAGPRATPTIDQGRVYAQGAAGLLVCLDGQSGKLIWKQDLCELLGIPLKRNRTLNGEEYLFEDSTLSWGRSGSPLIVGSSLFVAGGGPTSGPWSTLLALDKNTGEVKWKSGDQMIAYGSPSHLELAGVPQVVLVAEQSVLGFDPETGRELWSHQRPGASNAAANCSQAIKVSETRLLLTKGYGLGGELLEFSRNAAELQFKSVWKSSRVLTTKFSNPVISNGHAYALADGYLECVNLETGKLVWSLRDKFGHGQMLLVGDQLLVHSEFGKLGLIAARPEKPVWKVKVPTVDGLCWNTICLAGDKLIVRSDLEMACFQLSLEP